MITVVININGGTIVAKNAINTGKVNKKGETKYMCDGGDTIWQKRGDGAVALAKRLLDTIKNESVLR